MEKVGACGLVCSECGAYTATQANDSEAIARVAQEWSKEYNAEIDPESVWCDGCLSEGDRKCGHCAECGIRACVVGRGLANCALCGDYPCEDITRFCNSAPYVKEKLDEIRAAR